MASMKRAAIADLPLHGVRVPVWLAERMSTLGTATVEHIVLAYGTSELLARIIDFSLVPGAGLRHGNGLAFLRHYHVGDRCLKTANQSEVFRFGKRYLRGPRPTFHSHSRGAAEFRLLTRVGPRKTGAHDTSLSDFRKLTMPAHHDVRAEHVHLKRLGAVLAVAHERELVILPRCCWWRVSVRGRFNRWPSSPR